MFRGALVLFTLVVLTACSSGPTNPYIQVAAGNAAIDATRAAEYQRASYATQAAQATDYALRVQGTMQAMAATATEAGYAPTRAAQTQAAVQLTAGANSARATEDGAISMLRIQLEAEKAEKERQLVQQAYQATATAMYYDERKEEYSAAFWVCVPFALLTLICLGAVVWLVPVFFGRMHKARVVQLPAGFVVDGVYQSYYDQPAPARADSQRDRIQRVISEGHQRQALDRGQLRPVDVDQLPAEIYKPEHTGWDARVMELIEYSRTNAKLNPDGWHGRKLAGSRDVPGSPNDWTELIQVMKEHGAVETKPGVGTVLSEKYRNLMHLRTALDTGAVNFNLPPPPTPGENPYPQYVTARNR